MKIHTPNGAEIDLEKWKADAEPREFYPVLNLISVIEAVHEKTKLEPEPDPKNRATKEERIEQAAWCRGWKAAMHVVAQALEGGS